MHTLRNQSVSTSTERASWDCAIRWWTRCLTRRTAAAAAGLDWPDADLAMKSSCRCCLSLSARASSRDGLDWARRGIAGSLSGVDSAAALGWLGLLPRTVCASRYRRKAVSVVGRQTGFQTRGSMAELNNGRGGFVPGLRETSGAQLTESVCLSS
ncbi:hypothetical protein IWX49DRAFT_430135 [Phyllosticta citricarpa]|uniref:Uncharacterized protein n=2 Tax=Phyllosticta TaxID=121621 RepID=A0ABR1MBQ1_9PEZI